MNFLCRVSLLLLLCPLTAAAFEETVHRQEVDAGVHIPVLTKAPELQQQVEAAYPPDALKDGLTAEVRMKITIAADGTVSDAEVIQPVGRGFDESALAAVKQFRFSPAEVDNVPAPVQVEYVYHFAFAPPPPPEPDVPKAEPKATLTGTLVQRGSRTRIPGAAVRCGDDPDVPYAVSDEQGKFTLEVPAGTCSVHVEAPGYDHFQTSEKLAPNETVEVVYRLNEKAEGFQTIVRGDREKKEVVKRTLQREELQKIPGSFGDPVRVIQNFPGVARAPFLSGQLIVRGANPSQTLTFMDGVEIPLLYHLGGGPSVVNGEFLDRIDFYPGGFGARYGRAVGGVVDVATRQGASDTFHGVAKVDLQDSSIYVESPVGSNVSVAGAVRRSYIDALLPLVIPKNPNGGTILAIPQYWDYQVRVDVGTKRSELKNKNASTFSLMAFGSDDVLKLVVSGGAATRDISLDTHTLFHRLVGNWTYRSGPTTFTLVPYFGYDLGAANFGDIQFKTDRYNMGLRQDLAVDVNSHLIARAGLDLLYGHLYGRAQLPVLSGTQYPSFPGSQPKVELQTITRLLDSFDAALYAELDLKFGGLTITPGLRASHLYEHGQERLGLDPRLWVRYQFSPKTALKGSVGLYTQPPSVQTLEAPPLGNPDLVHEKAFQSSVGIEQRITDVIHVDVTGFFNRRFDNIVSPGETIVNDDGSLTRQQSSNDGLGRAYGVEVMLRHDVTKKFFGWLAYTFNRSEERRRGEDSYYLTTYDQTHILTLVASYKLPFNFEVGGRFRLVSGRPITPLIHPYDLYQADSNSYASTRGDFRSTRLPAFHQLDIRIDKNFPFTSWTLTVYADVQNVYNQANVESTFTDYRNRKEYFIPGIPILPIVGVRGSF